MYYNLHNLINSPLLNTYKDYYIGFKDKYKRYPIKLKSKEQIDFLSIYTKEILEEHHYYKIKDLLKEYEEGYYPLELLIRVQSFIKEYFRNKIK